MFLNDRFDINFNNDLIEVNTLGGKTYNMPANNKSDITIDIPTEDNWDLINELDNLFRTNECFSIGSYIDMVIHGMSLSTYSCTVDIILTDYDPNRKDWKDWFIK